MAIDNSVYLGGAILLVMGMICGHTAKTYKNRDFKVWFILGMLFGLLALIVLYIMPPKKNLKEAVETVSIQSKTNPTITQGDSDKKSSYNPLPMITNQWYYLDNTENQVGPLSFQRLKDAYIEGKVHDTNYVWNESMSDWKKLSDLSDYLDILKE